MDTYIGQLDVAGTLDDCSDIFGFLLLLKMLFEKHCLQMGLNINAEEEKI